MSVEELIAEVELLQNEGDCVGLRFNEILGFFVQIQELDNELYYMVEPSVVDIDNCFTPCEEPIFIPFNKFDKLKIMIGEVSL